MKNSYIIGAMLFYSCSCAFGSDSSYKAACSKEKVPGGLELQVTHGLNFYSFPKEQPRNYTGCAYMWLEDGQKLYSTYYVNGVVAWIYGHDPDEPMKECFYVGGVLKGQNKLSEAKCPSNPN